MDGTLKSDDRDKVPWYLLNPDGVRRLQSHKINGVTRYSLMVLFRLKSTKNVTVMHMVRLYSSQ